MRVFLLRFVRVGDQTAQLTDMYDTSHLKAGLVELFIGYFLFQKFLFMVSTKQNATWLLGAMFKEK